MISNHLDFEEAFDSLEVKVWELQALGIKCPLAESPWEVVKSEDMVTTLSKGRKVALINYLETLRGKGGVLPAFIVDAAYDGQLVGLKGSMTGYHKKVLKLFYGAGWQDFVVDKKGLCPIQLVLCNTVPNKTPANIAKKMVVGDTQLKERYLLHEEEAKAFIQATGKEYEDTIRLGGRIEFSYTSEGLVHFTAKDRYSRYVYSLRNGQDLVIQDSMLVLSVICLWAVTGISRDYLSLILSKTGTSLLASTRCYADPAPYNDVSDQYTVGHLQLANGVGLLPKVVNDGDKKSVIRAASLAYEQGWPVYYQHQLQHIRVLKGATAAGNNTVSIWNQDGHEVKVSLAATQVDKAKKLFNRGSLLNRVPPVVEWTTNNHETDEAMVNDIMADFEV